MFYKFTAEASLFVEVNVRGWPSLSWFVGRYFVGRVDTVLFFSIYALTFKHSLNLLKIHTHHLKPVCM